MRFINALVACSVIAITSSSVLAQSTAVQWTTASGGNGHWYLRWTDPVQTDWSAIGQLAASKGAQLLTVSSAAEQTFFFDLFGSAVIGLSAAPGSSEFVWATGEEVSFSNWGTSQCGFGPYPNNPNTNRRFVIMNFGPCVGSHGIRPAWDDYELSELGPTIIGIGLEWSADCNADGIVDYGQILSGQLIDANGDGIPDICEVDPCPGDISGNGAVDGVDLTLLLGVWGTDGIGGEFDADITNDGIVGGADLTVLFSGWGPCPPPILPWATVLEQNVNPAVVTDATLRNAITATGLPWRVRDNGTNIEMLLVPGGTFMMGCSPGDAECYESENPAHQVTLTNAFYLSKTEVTQAQWQAKMESNPSSFQGQSDSPSRPVENVSWIMAQGFNTATGFRLPTEAEWEYACRAGTTTARYGLENNISWNLFNSGSVSHAVATKLPNALGLYDTLGNVWEWCQDWYGDMYYASSPSENPTGPTAGTYRVLHGGGLLAGSNSTRASVRGWNIPSNVQNVYGFRVARNP